jgi:Fe-S-cluster-containing hydrogenase component 2
MKIVRFVSRVDPQKCNGARRCERLWPSGAVKVVEKTRGQEDERAKASGTHFESKREQGRHKRSPGT